MRFTKMEGLGNDYLFVYDEVPADVSEISKKLSDRHFGVGSDGMIFISSSAVADCRMRIFNADGSEAQMCGNGIRCVGKYLFDKGYTDKTIITVETLAGIRKLDLHLCGGVISGVTVDMGKAVVGDKIDFEYETQTVSGTYVSMGNPHFVIFVDIVENIDIQTIGRVIEHHRMFPDGINVEFVQVISDNQIRMRVWERGSGITCACGTGACAGVAASVKYGYCRKNEPVSVLLDGGHLSVSVDENYAVSMTGPAEFVYEGETEI